jgi:quercetin dioxygenase-like cupin family protein
MLSVTNRLKVVAWCVLVLSVAASWIAYAQQSPNFVGKTEPLDGSNISSSRRYFDAGARSNWHAHANGQLILNEKGSGLHQIEGRPIQRLAAGDSVYVGPGVVHWHGAAPDAAFTQVSIGFGGTTKWGEPVAEPAYRGVSP